jgi:hypothetical protein
MFDTCGICGGDGRIANSFSGSTATCPGCHGTGRKADNVGFHDVTKTKPSHHRPANQPAAQKKQAQEPTTALGIQLVKEVQAGGLSAEVKAKLTREIVEHEAAHGQCTQTFVKKLRKQLRPAS